MTIDYEFSELEKKVLAELVPMPDSHKGQNGKVLVIGGSELFHAASKWSLDVLTRLVDMVFYSSTAENNELVEAELLKEAKGEFWGGIVVNRADLDKYLEEAEAVLIGPGMMRSEETAELTNRLLRDNPTKKWVIDAGALQMLDVKLIPAKAILTPHHGELEILNERFQATNLADKESDFVCLVKGEIDKIWHNGQVVAEIAGGNAGMTKGGTGDCLAGLVAGIYAQSSVEPVEIAKVASKICKKAGDWLWQEGELGPFFNASDLAATIPRVLWQTITENGLS